MILDQLQLPSQQHGVNISAKLIASITMLQYSAQELEEAISRELAENPALEVEEVIQCQRCGTTLRGGLCPRCERYAEPTDDGRSEVAGWDEYGDLRNAAAVGDDGDFDPLELVCSGATLYEYLLRQLGATVSDEDYPIVEFLIGSLNSHGYLTISVEEVAEALTVPSERVEAALLLLQSLGPPGIGARDLGECLRIQLCHLSARDEVTPLVARLVAGYMRDLGERRFAEIARGIGATAPEVMRAWQFIRTNLNPYPTHAFESGDVPGQGLTLPAERSMIVRPDVVIRKTAIGFEAEVVEMRRFKFSMGDMYQTLYRQSKSHHESSAGLDESGKQHVREYVTRTRFFMSCMRQRWETLATI